MAWILGYGISVSHKKKFIYFHNPKAAMTSLAKSLRESDAEMLPSVNIWDRHYISGMKDPMYDEYFKFSFVRNPWARSVSAYQNIYYDRFENFKEFVQFVNRQNVKHNNTNQHLQSQSFLIPVGKLDYIGRIETIEDDFKKLCDKLNINGAQLFHMNKSKGKVIEHENYRDYYTLDTQQTIASKYADDVNNFGYSF